MTPRARRGGLLLVLAAGLVSCPITSHAQSQPELGGEASPEQRAARDDFRAASRLADTGRWAEALVLYRASFERFPHATTLNNIGYCRERLGDYAGALRDTQQALELTQDQPDRGLSPERRASAERALEALRPRVAVVELVPTASGVTVRVGGSSLVSVGRGEDPLHFRNDGDGAPYPLPVRIQLVINPGSHVVEWASSGNTTELPVSVAAGSRSTLTWPAPLPSVPPGASAARPSVVAGAPLGSAPSSSPVPTRHARPLPAEPGRPLHTLAVASFVVTGAAVAVGLGAGVIALTTKNKLDNRCAEDGACPVSENERRERLLVATKVSNLGFAASALTGALGVTLLLLEGSRGGSGSLGVRVSNGIAAEGRFD